MSKYINPYTDFGFKKLFGEEGNKALLIDFLNQLLPVRHQISEITFQNVEALPDTNEERKAFFDIHCKAESGERFIVEMQKAKVEHFKDRSMYYITYPIREQAQRGEWDFELSPIYFIGVLDFWYEDKKTAKFRRDIVLKDQENEPFYDKLQLTYLQMPAFNKTESELNGHFDKWAYFLKNLEKFEDIPQILNEPIFTQAFQTAKVANFTKKEREDYEKSRLSYIGIKQVTSTAEADGVQKGKAEAEAKAREEAEKKEVETILGLYDNGVPIVIIAKSLNKTEEKVSAIIKKHRK
jgi:predicted transposase/invertase (TIGR01784 family)